MSKEEILFLKSMLLDRRSSVLDRVKRLAVAWQELEERATELEEEAQKASISRPYDQLDVSGKQEIEQIDLALTKMTLGDYGICESCGDDISPRRLQVIPWTRLCVECARDFEKKHRSLPITTEAIGSAKLPDEFQGLSEQQVVNAIIERLQSDERIDTDELKIAVRKGVIYLDGTVPGEVEHDIIVQILTDLMGFSAVVDRIDVNDLILGQEDYEDGSSGRTGVGERLFYDNDDMQEDAFESRGGGSSPFFGSFDTGSVETD